MSAGGRGVPAVWVDAGGRGVPAVSVDAGGRGAPAVTWPSCVWMLEGMDGHAMRSALTAR